MQTLENGLLVTDDAIMGYIFNFNGHGSFAPDGKVGELSQAQVDAHNAALAKIELDAILEAGRGMFYLFYTDGKVSHVGTWASKPGERLRVSCSRKSWHNFAGRDGRTDVWFRMDGSEWHGVNIGDSDIVRVKRLKTS